jgi:hypothetical protein
LEAQYKAELQAEIKGESFTDFSQKPQKPQKSKKKLAKVPEKVIPNVENVASAVVMMTKKHRNLYRRIQYGIKRKQAVTNALVEKRKTLEEVEKLEKKKKRKLM